MQELVVGSVTYNANDFSGLEDALSKIKQLVSSERAGWEAFYKRDYELELLKDFISQKAPDILREWEIKNAKKIYGKSRRRDRENSKKSCR